MCYEVFNKWFILNKNLLILRSNKHLNFAERAEQLILLFSVFSVCSIWINYSFKQVWPASLIIWQLKVTSYFSISLNSNGQPDYWTDGHGLDVDVKWFSFASLWLEGWKLVCCMVRIQFLVTLWPIYCQMKELEETYKLYNEVSFLSYRAVTFKWSVSERGIVQVRCSAALISSPHRFLCHCLELLSV